MEVIDDPLQVFDETRFVRLHLQCVRALLCQKVDIRDSLATLPWCSGSDFAAHSQHCALNLISVRLNLRQHDGITRIATAVGIPDDVVRDFTKALVASTTSSSNCENRRWRASNTSKCSRIWNSTPHAPRRCSKVDEIPADVTPTKFLRISSVPRYEPRGTKIRRSLATSRAWSACIIMRK